VSATLFLAELYKGDHPMLVRLRNQLAEIARTPGLVTVLIEGEPGTGKTTMARGLAMARVLSMVDAEYHRISVERAVREVREGAALKWYRDISLAGLSDRLADSQLFGIGKGVATDVVPRIGIFEQAMTGCVESKSPKSHRELVAEAKRESDLISLATGGIVLLDEIGDLAPELQAKLLRILNGEAQYRIGTEGNPDFGYVFRGLVAMATWRDIDGECALRDDLRQRISQHRIRVPSLSEYPFESRLQIVVSATEVVKQEIRDALAITESLVAGRQVNDCQVLATDWLEHANRGAEGKVGKATLTQLANVDWATHGQLRGLRSTLRRILCGCEVETALLENDAAFNRAPAASEAETSVARLQRYLEENNRFSDAWLNDRRSWASDILQRIELGDSAVQQAITGAGRSSSDVKKDLRNLMRSGSNSSGE
jgi:Sigma-54 interaction domain